MKYKTNIIFLFLLNFCSALEADNLKNLHEQIKNGNKICAVGFNLRSAELKNHNFEGADFSGADLRKANFYGSNLSKASFNKANLSKVNFEHTQLNGADLTDANVNGARFKNSRIYGVNYYFLKSAKGTLFDDKEQFLKRMAYEEKINKIKKEFIQDNDRSIFISENMKFELIYNHLITLKKLKTEYAVIDFTTLKENKFELLKNYMEFLHCAIFFNIIDEIITEFDNKYIIVFLKNKNLNFIKNKAYHTSLDLHFKSSLSFKYKKIYRFIKKSYWSQSGVIQIITGRGIHNPEGKMGILWNLCRAYLLKSKFYPYIQKIESINKQGGWKITLNSAQRNKKDKGKKRNKYITRLYGTNIFFKHNKILSAHPHLAS